ncbi:endoplasmic reticulum-Golgi intermediate compartment protein 3-like [Histomonas meleagridis]|uniref:endoplasmic reticulum-Golgi intermediate compartment protein 3-like n=1 Tax=Histomonas meleagridis TaxID=135588 RepID=UPI00355AA815|nr:endoplasmic reticulum-Golgi intermediate compartment protein 3-like [Histomonas meleagridis]KAH0804072.1 endoplasmic reticulum-Golgi intermediate compartment protein 3-like [Histomonas meleagridis]
MLTKFDFFPKYTDSDVKVKTFGGAVLSILTICAMTILFWHEFLQLFIPRLHDEIVVDTSRVGIYRTMAVTFNMTIYSPCNHFIPIAYDSDGNRQINVHNEIRKQTIDENGYATGSKEWISIKKHNVKNRNNTPTRPQTCGSCYGAGTKGQCCQTCDDVIDAFKAKGWDLSSMDKWQQCIDEGYVNFGKESCLISGMIKLPRVRGTLLFTTVDDAKPAGKKLRDISHVSRSLNLSHTIHYFEIGANVPGMKHPLDSLTFIQKQKGRMSYKYRLNVVPTKWISTRMFEVNTYKFTPVFVQKNITETMTRDVPGIYFQFDIAPFSVVSTETTYSLWQLIKSICAIVGGAFACASLADQFLFRALTTMEGKRRIGKDL